MIIPAIAKPTTVTLLKKQHYLKKVPILLCIVYTVLR